MGIVLAIIILFSCALHLWYILSHQPLQLTDLFFWLHLLIQMWLFTGLFITAHDAMHGSISKNKAVNNIIGFMATLLYAGMWYPSLIRKHNLHHKFPASENDPDYLVGNQHFFNWWFLFMKQYLTLWQLLFMAALFNIGMIFYSQTALIVFWVIPVFLSTFQLFYFGTYRPHRLPHTSDMTPYQSRSQHRNHFLAFFSCYFFGYHYEHHASPSTPWWKLYRLKDREKK